MTLKVTKELLDRHFQDMLVGHFGYGCVIACMGGWYGLIYDTLFDIGKADPQAGVIQIKEKFGGLDIHTNSQKEEVWKICEKARASSLEICESCGTMEDVTQRSKGYWMKTMCQKCFDDWK